MEPAVGCRRRHGLGQCTGAQAAGRAGGGQRHGPHRQRRHRPRCGSRQRRGQAGTYRHRRPRSARGARPEAGAQGFGDLHRGPQGHHHLERFQQRARQCRLRRGGRQPGHRGAGRHRGPALGTALHRVAQPAGQRQRRPRVRPVPRRRDQLQQRRLRTEHPPDRAGELVGQPRRVQARRGRLRRR
ncbi:hypothetical protein D9M72_538080 [compost metagenome]